MTYLPLLGRIMSIRAQNRAMKVEYNANVAQDRLTRQNLIKAYNRNVMNAEQTRRSLFTSFIDDVTNTMLQGKRLDASVAEAVNENLEGGGRTANMLKNAPKHDLQRALDSAHSNLEARLNELDLNKESAYYDLMENLNSMQAPTKPHVDWAGMTAQLLSAYNQTRQLQHNYNMNSITPFSTTSYINKANFTFKPQPLYYQYNPYFSVQPAFSQLQSEYTFKPVHFQY